MITEPQRRALFALREALRLCEGADVRLRAQSDLAVELEVQGAGFFYSNHPFLDDDFVSSVISRYPEPTERFVGKATPETAFGNGLSWRFRTTAGRILRWSGENTSAWWATDKPQTVTGYRLDWATCDVFEVPL